MSAAKTYDVPVHCTRCGRNVTTVQATEPINVFETKRKIVAASAAHGLVCYSESKLPMKVGHA